MWDTVTPLPFSHREEKQRSQARGYNLSPEASGILSHPGLAEAIDVLAKPSIRNLASQNKWQNPVVLESWPGNFRPPDRLQCPWHGPTPLPAPSPFQRLLECHASVVTGSMCLGHVGSSRPRTDMQRLLRTALNVCGVASGKATTKYLSPLRRVLSIEQIVQNWILYLSHWPTGLCSKLMLVM